MRRILLVAAALATLAACASNGPEGNPWYTQGDANYDALKAAADACKAKGGDFELKTGGDPTHLGDYGCNPKKVS
jgi:ABC-type glycerol-3-phosphate transport system substrate-binding protein